MPAAKHNLARSEVGEALKAAHTADQVIAFSDDAAQSAVHALTNAIRHLGNAILASMPARSTKRSGR